MNLPSFLWLWKIAAWSMGLSITGYLLLAFSGIYLWKNRKEKNLALLGYVLFIGLQAQF